MEEHGSKYYARRPFPRTWGSKGQKSTFSEHGHVAYEIKGNHKCNNIVVNILPADPPSHPAPDPEGDVNRAEMKGSQQQGTLVHFWANNYLASLTMYKNHFRTVLTPFDHQITIKC